jgi:acyl-coenzyme A synthetase/AMP-(fatty) acid ligase
MNTAVHQPEGSSAPRLIRFVRTPGLLDTICIKTPGFVRGTMAIGRPRPTPDVRAAYESPYGTPERRTAIAAFVEDIPLDDEHPSQAALDAVAANLERLDGVPALLLWGPADPVFSDLYLQDLAGRLPGADIHRFEGAGHLTPEDAEIAPVIYRWIEDRESPTPERGLPGDRTPLWGEIDRRSGDGDIAIVEMGDDGEKRSLSFADFAEDVHCIVAGLASIGVTRGDRVALLVPPGIDLAVSLYAVWRAGAVAVMVDAGLGARGIGRALKGADPSYLIGSPKALAAARTMGWPGVRISNTPLRSVVRTAIGVQHTLDEIRAAGEAADEPPAPSSEDVAAIGFTSGATGPAKGVVYRHRQLEAQRDALVALFDIGSDDRLVAAFGLFALFGPAMGIASAVPDMDVTSPGSLEAAALGRAVAAIDATLVFASPAAIRSVVATAGDMSPREVSALHGVRLLMSAGAPVPTATLRAARPLMPNAGMHSPYGMTEVLPVADISLAELDGILPGNGICVGFPVDGVDVGIAPIDATGTAAETFTDESGVTGEICIRAPHMRDGYDKLWATQDAASRPSGWHRSGDVGHLDDDGRLWVEGRIGHVVTTAAGPVTPVGIEHAVGEVPGVGLVGVVGVGPVGTQQVVVVVETNARSRKAELASADLAANVRRVASPIDVAAVLVVPSIPVDKRHNSKIDRTRIARWAERVLAGGRMGRP